MAKYDKDQLLADWRAGGYTQNELAHKHKTSRSNVAKIVNGIEKDLVTTVTKKIHIEQEIAELSDKEVTSVTEQTKQAIEDAKMIRSLTKSNMIGVADKLSQYEALNMLDHKNAQDLIDKASITLKVNQRHANNSINVDASANANNETKKIIIIDAVAEKAKAEQE